MPEIWLNYGDADAVLEIMAENLAFIIDSGTAYREGYGRKTADTPVDQGSAGANDTSLANNTHNNTDYNTDASATLRHSEPTTPSNNKIDHIHNNDANGANNNRSTIPTAKPDALHTSTTPPLVLGHNEISERLGTLDFEKPFDLAPLHDSQSVRQIISSIFTVCEQRSAQFPSILADSDVLSTLRHGLPEGSVAGELATSIIDGEIMGSAKKVDGNNDGRRLVQTQDTSGSIVDTVKDNISTDVNSRNLIFLAETEFDGLFGYETIATRLIRKFGADEMLAAYAKREGNTPFPGRRTKSFDEALKFSDRFEIRGIDIVANTNGICDLFIGNPQSTAKESSASLEMHSVMDAESQKTLIVSTGKTSSNITLADAFSSVWNCYGAVRNNGLCILVAACPRGLGSVALRMAVEGRLHAEHLQNPSEYIDGMEELLFLNDAKNRCQIALVSVLPELYSAKLGVIPIAGMKQAIEYMKTTQGARQKASVITDGSRILLR